MSTLGIQQLFREERFPNGWRIFPLILYAPIGIVLATLRSFIGFQTLLAASFVPQVAIIKSMILRTLCFTLGIVIREENSEKRDQSVKLLIANHLSFLDFIPVHFLTGCATPGRWEARSSWVVNLKSWAQGDSLIANTRSHLRSSNIPVLIQPECATTSGNTGLLKFETWPLETVKKVQPVVVKVWRPAIADVAVTVLAASDLWDMIFYLFVPFTVFTVRYLNVIEMEDDESPAHCMERIESAIATDLGVCTTKFSVKDKAEYEKRYLAELYRPAVVPNGSGLRLQPTQPQLLRMSNQVKEVLPYVPLDAIRRDLARTWDVDLTITNILEGLVPYIPEGQPGQSSNLQGQSRTTETIKTSSDQVASPSFMKSSKERALSFQERKAQMIAEARRKYIEKHGLQNTSP